MRSCFILEKLLVPIRILHFFLHNFVIGPDNSDILCYVQWSFQVFNCLNLLGSTDMPFCERMYLKNFTSCIKYIFLFLVFQ